MYIMYRYIIFIAIPNENGDPTTIITDCNEEKRARREQINNWKCYVLRNVFDDANNGGYTHTHPPLSIGKNIRSHAIQAKIKSQEIEKLFLWCCPDAQLLLFSLSSRSSIFSLSFH